jgi:Na+/H+-dicarboxylate symporter
MAVMFLSPSMEVPSLMGMLPFIMMLGVVMIAAPGAPGGAVMSALGLLTSMLGFNEGAVALMIALYLAQDSFGTACNVTGDGIIALWVDRFSEKAAS